jgi:hypothetical protein
MAHERDHDHPPPPTPRQDPAQPSSLPKPDRVHADHPTGVPREPVDPRSHPSRRLSAARPR